MHRDGSVPRVERARFGAEHLWLGSVLFFGFGDLLTTSVGLGTLGVVEVNPIVALLERRFGFGALIALKAAVLACCYGVWRATPRPYCDGLPLGLATAGVMITAWNVHILAVAYLS